MIEKMLVLSTAHLTPETCNDWLPFSVGSHPVWEKGDYGWFVYVSEEPGDIPTDLEGCIHYARYIGVEWIMFDRDADELDPRLLPVFEW